MKCANCPAEAIYSLVTPRVSPVHYCARCLPPHLLAAASAGQLPLKTASQLAEENKGPAPEAPAKKKRKAKSGTVAEASATLTEEELTAAIADGYDSAATDGDGDGVVQDGTAFERAEGEVLVDYSEESTEEGV